jgi:hypothetical protein
MPQAHDPRANDFELMEISSIDQYCPAATGATTDTGLCSTCRCIIVFVAPLMIEERNDFLDEMDP